MWFTIHESFNEISRDLIETILKVKAIVKEFTNVYWIGPMELTTDIQLTKIDFCQDLLGSFIP